MLGETLGPYRIDCLLGSGGMGKVYLATVAGSVPDVAEGTKVALKVIRGHLVERPGFFERFVREAKAGKAIRHPNVVRTVDADSCAIGAREHSFLVMDYYDGRTLRPRPPRLRRVGWARAVPQRRGSGHGPAGRLPPTSDPPRPDRAALVAGPGGSRTHPGAAHVRPAPAAANACEGCGTASRLRWTAHAGG